MHIPGWAALILAACIVCTESTLENNNKFNNLLPESATKKPSSLGDFIFKSAHKEVKFKKKEKERDKDVDLRVGQAINIFPRYGSLTLFMKVKINVVMMRASVKINY